MKRNKKLTIIALSVLLVMTLAATVVSFSLANRGKRTNAPDGVDLVAENTGTVLTNIDYIVKATSSADADPYIVVEIGSKNTTALTTFGSFASKGDFREFVINGNKTIDDMEMAEGKVEYKYFYAGDVTKDNTEALAYISSADFIYVSAAEPYSIAAGNDMGEDLYNILHVAAVGDYKPFIIDKPSSAGSSEIEDGDSSMKFADLAKNYFTKMGSQYNAYFWDETAVKDATAFYSGAIGSGSYYSALSGRARSSYWTTVKPTADSEDQFEMADILVISSAGTSISGNGDMLSKVLSGNKGEATGLYVVSSETASEELVLEDNQKVYSIDSTTPLYSTGYSKKYVQKPEYMRVTEVTLADLDSDDYASFDFTKYDLVVIEDDCGGTVISADLYKRLVALMYANTHIIFDYALGSTSTDPGTGGGSTTTDEDTNYQELYSMVATQDDIARYQNIMVTDATQLGVIATSKSAATCKVIADLINSASFRGIGGPGSTATTFTVLEIQPCYPIDTYIAAEKGNYYTIPSDVVNGSTKEQIGIEVDENGETVVEQGTPEYYAWELSEAKIADALDMDATQVKVVHMSSEEFASSKDAIFGNYDMIYIGGNNSAIKEAKDWRSIETHAYSFASTMTSATGRGFNMNDLVKLPIYCMYSHAGDFVQADIVFTGSSPGPVNSGTPYSVVPGTAADGSETFSTMNGNDISYNSLVDLQKYVEAGMPVVISKEVNDAYGLIVAARDAKTSEYLQNSIDPDSNMCKFLDSCYGSTKGNVLWGFDHTQTEYTDNDGGRLGNTLTGKVEVFADLGDRTDRTDLKALYLGSSARPKLAVTSMPAVYNMYDDSTKMDSLTLTYEFDVTGTGAAGYDVYLYADYNLNSVFSMTDNPDTTEVIAHAENVSTISANLANNAKYGESHSGPVYWKLEVVDKASGASVSVNKIAFIKPPVGEKKQINVLQILPDEAITAAYNGNGYVSLIFCTECQRAQEILDRNPSSVSKLPVSDDPGDYGDLYWGSIDDSSLNADGTFQGIYTGLHEHRFGIVEYNSATGMDDWNTNLADDIEDLYDVNIDIISTREYEAYNTEVIKGLEAHLAAYYEGRTIDQLSEDEIEELNGDLNDALSDARDEYEQYQHLDYYFDDYAGHPEFYGKSYEELTAVERAELASAVAGDELAKAEYDLKAFIYSVKDTCTDATAAAAWNHIYEGDRYADYVMYIFGENIQFMDVNAPDYHYNEYKPLYEAYAKVLDKKIEAEMAYDKALRLANYDNWLLGCYQTVIVGPAEDFAGDDIKDEAALATLQDFLKRDGSMLLFHDTLTKFSDNGSINLTNTLLDYYGMDKNHVEVDDSKRKDVTITEAVTTIKNGGWMAPAFYLTIDGVTNSYNASVSYDKTTAQVTVKDGVYSDSTDVKYGDVALAGAGEVEYTISLSKAELVNYNEVWSVVANKEVTFTMGSFTATGTTDANGNVTFKVPNFDVNDVTTTYSADDTWYVPYKLKDGYTDTNKYFLTNLSYKPSDDDSRYVTWKSDMEALYPTHFGRNELYYSAMYAYTDSISIAGYTNEAASPYKYTDYSWAVAATWGNGSATPDGGSNKASQTNKGILTMYPFTLSDELNISPTHAQAYALDIENEDLSVWYTIAGGSNKAGSDLYAASPRDGMDSYFIYSIGNLNYCSAGHCEITGPDKDNNDERRLYINIICNSVTNVAQTTINAYDYDTTKTGVKNNNIVKKQGSEYVIKLDENDNVPEFMFDFDLGKGATLSRVNVYFDVDGDGKFTSVKEGEDPIDRYILQTNTMEEGALCYLPISFENADAVKALTINPETDLTNGKYVYIVIEVIDTDGNKTRKKIKVEYKDKLYNLT